MTVHHIEYANDDHLADALELALRGITGPMKVNLWQTGTDAKGGYLQLGRGDRSDGGWNALPSLMNAATAALMVEGWLSNVDYGKAPDTDGSVRKGFALDNGCTNDGWSSAVVTIRPRWVVYGK